MKLLLYLSDFIVPVTILGIVAYGVFNKVNVYDDFIKQSNQFWNPCHIL